MESIAEHQPKFFIGQLVHHKKFDYRGVIVDVDPVFSGTDEWYDKVALSRPPRDRPWYRVLVHGHASETYVAERHLEPDASADPVEHPAVGIVFDEFSEGVYRRRSH